MATSGVDGDKYRSCLTEEDIKNTKWIDDEVPNYDDVNKLFEEGRTKVWPAGSSEEKVQNLVKTWEMELVHKANPEDYKTVDPKKFVIGINGTQFFTLEEVGKIGGSYNVFLQTSLPSEFRVFDPEKETYESSQAAFKTAFPRGFAVEILQVYSGPPVIAYKFRHWGYMEGPFKGYAPTGKLVEFFGTSIIEMEDSKVVKVDFFYDRGELLAQLIKGEKTGELSITAPSTNAPSGCPFMA
ncbi:Pathogen-related protein [Sesamum alatum]|uniref:Pathogen-related protein n=1 Tax=Sesamum alatum TaxID=300844 RepID=A0AAE2CPM3_9LAMI|nr:Pathogen-related protein [Sesamum alatum]